MFVIWYKIVYRWQGHIEKNHFFIFRVYHRYQLLLEAVDSIIGQSMLIRNVMGLPERDNEFPDGETGIGYSFISFTQKSIMHFLAV